MARAIKANFMGCFICALGAIFYCYEYLLRIIPGVIQAELMQHFSNISATAFGTLSAYYYFAYTPMQIPVGMLMDRYKAHKLLTMACGFCAMGSMMFVLTPNYLIAAVGRFFIGFGSAFAFVGVLSLGNDWLPEKYFSLLTGIVTMLGMVGAILGAVGMTALVEIYGWQVILYGAAWIGIGLTVVIALFIKDKPKEKKSTPPLSFQAFVHEVGAVLCCGQIWLAGIVGAILYLSLSVFAEIWGKSYLMVAHGLSKFQSASSISMIFLGWALGAPIIGFFADSLGNRLRFLMLGSLVAAAAISAVIYSDSLTLLSINILLFLYGFSCSTEVLVFALARANSPHHSIVSTVFAAVNMIIMMSGAVCQPLVGKLLDSIWDGKVYHHLRVYSKLDYQIVLSILPLALLLSTVIVFFLKDNKHS